MLNFRRVSARLAKGVKIALDLAAGRAGSPEWYALDEPDEKAADRAYTEAYLRERLRAASSRR